MDLSRMVDFFSGLGIKDITKTENGDADSLDEGFKKLREKFKEADKSRTKKVLAFVYYSGHGAMDTTTKIVLNSEDKIEQIWPLESKLSVITSYQNTYLVSIFDCCREEIPKEDMRGGNGE